MKDEASAVVDARAARRKEAWIGFDADEGIDVRKCVDLLFKRKASILAPFVFLSAASAVLSFTSPNVYEVSVVIEPPIGGRSEATGVVALDTVLNIKAKIESGAYEDKIAKMLNLDKHRRIDLKVDTKVNPALDANYIKSMKIIVRETADKTEVGKKILSTLLDALNQEYAQFLTDKLNQIDNAIKMTAAEIAGKEDEIRRDNEEIKIKDNRENEFLQEIKSARDNSAKLLEKRENFLNSGGRDEISSLLYTNTIQENLTYVSQLQNQLTMLRNERENKVFDMRSANNAIGMKRIQIENLKMSKDTIHGVVVIQEPRVSEFPVGPHRLRNIFVAGVAGLVLGVFFVFLSEWWQSGSTLVHG